MYTTAIIDDDPFSHEVLRELIEREFPEYEVAGIYEDKDSALKGLQSGEVDLVFLDMELGPDKGFDVLKELGGIPFEVIITTTHESFMLEAIQNAAVDYLMKPISRDALSEALKRFEARISDRESGAEPGGRLISQIQKMALPTQDGLVLVPISDIIRLESDGAYTRFKLTSDKEIMTSRNLGVYEDQLSAHSFIRVHHKSLINLAHVERYVRGEGGYVVMSDGVSVDVSRRKKDEFLRQLGI